MPEIRAGVQGAGGGGPQFTQEAAWAQAAREASMGGGGPRFEREAAAMLRDQMLRGFSEITRAANATLGRSIDQIMRGYGKQEALFLREKTKADNEFLRNWRTAIRSGFRENIRDQDRAEKKRIADEARARRESDSAGRRAAQAHETTHQNVIRRAYQGAVIGGLTVSALARGDIPGAAGVLGGELGAVGGSLVGGPIGSIIGGIVGDIIGRIVINPVGPIYQAAKEAITVRWGAFNLSRIGNDLSGNTLTGAFRLNRRTPAAWMAGMGTGAKEILENLRELGVPLPENRQIPMAQFMTLAQRSPAMRGVPEMVPELIRQSMNLGMASPAGGANTFMTQFFRLNTQSMAHGMDDSTLIKAMARSLDMLAKSGAAGINVGNISDLYYRLLAGGTPGGRVGDLATTITAGAAETSADIFKNPFAATILQSAVGKYGGLRSLRDIQAFTGIANPSGAQSAIMQRVMREARLKQTPQALRDVATLFADNPQRLVQVLQQSSFFANMPKDTRDMLLPGAVSQFLDIPYNKALDYVISANVKMPTGPDATTDFMTRGMAQMGLTKAAKITDPQLIARLKKMGVSSAVASQVVAAARRHGLDPAWFAAMGLQESGLRINAKSNYNANNNTTDYGIYQLNSRTFPGGRAMSWQQNIETAATYEAKLAGGGMTPLSINRYNGGRGYFSNVSNKFNAITGAGYSNLGIPQDVSNLIALGQQGDLFQSNIALKNLGQSATNAAKAMDKFTGQLSTLTEFLSGPKGAAHVLGWDKPAAPSPKGWRLLSPRTMIHDPDYSGLP